jgi:hypothetical protein
LSGINWENNIENNNTLTIKIQIWS